MNDTDILISELSGDKLADALDRYYKGEPAAYVLGEWEFFGDRYKITPDVLIPRCDTERVTEKLIELLPQNGVFLDVGTGSGCIAISALKRRPDATAYAVDISNKALSVAKINAGNNGVSDRITFEERDASHPFVGFDNRFDVIVSNPPYIASRELEKLDEYVKKEPRSALDGGDDGLCFYSAIIKNHAKLLKENGIFLFEIGSDQKDALEKLADENGFESSFFKDYASHWRVAVLKRKTN